MDCLFTLSMENNKEIAKYAACKHLSYSVDNKEQIGMQKKSNIVYNLLD